MASDSSSKIVIDEILSPPNGGYGWVVAVLCAISMFFASGMLNSVGNLLDTFVEV